jgi:hypothetical protein
MFPSDERDRRFGASFSEPVRHQFDGMIDEFRRSAGLKGL